MSKYEQYTPEELESHFSNYLLNSWSYSKISAFARNEKAFEMSYIFKCYGKSSASTVAGEAYHNALQYYFHSLSEGEVLPLNELEASAFQYIGEVPAHKWKLQTTTPTIDECIAKATKTVSSLLLNFYSEKEIYECELAEILGVELSCTEWVTINGVEIPMPCHAKIDLVIKLKDGNVVVIDHKSKASYTGEDEVSMVIGTQAITYVKCYEKQTGIQVNQVWFVENKISKNKDGRPQLQATKIEINEDARKIYESLLYEPLRRMVQAVNDPDYVYIINNNDNFTDRAELYDFWCRTQIAEIDDFNIDTDKRELVSKRLKKIRDSSIAAINPKVIQEFKKNAAAFIQYDLSNTNMTPQEKIEHTLRKFGIIANVAHAFNGYSSNTYLLEMSAGTKISNVYKYRLDLASALDVSNIRIQQDLSVYQGKSYLSLDFSTKRERDLLFNPQDLDGMRLPIGKDNFDQTIVWDLNNSATPHVLVCGATGSGKSVMIKSTIEYALLSGVSDIVILDPKFEFTYYNSKGIEVINDIEEIELKMRQLVEEMQDRVKEGIHRKTLVVFDEFADALAQSKSGNELKEYAQVVDGINSKGMPRYKRALVAEHKSLEENLKMLLQKGRSSGYRVIAATQRASTKVITGDAKVNFPVQICFRVPKEMDSRVVLDESGAESLSGFGDGLIKSPEYSNTVRFQGYLFGVSI